MDNPMFYVTVSLSSLAAVALIAVTGLKGFTAWIDLKRTELGARGPVEAHASTGNRIEVADLKERLRKLEAIAAGVDL
ncbi:MAG: hypothetical protein RL367_2304 [Pseudomonadota bacterium]